MNTHCFEFDAVETSTELMEPQPRRERRTIRLKRKRYTRGVDRQHIGKRGGIHLRRNKPLNW